MHVTVEQLSAESIPQELRQRCEVWTRVMGYHRPVAAFNPGKQSEHRERRHFTEASTQRASA
ncbi:MAG: anaerobic ribonucleoside-triphosphate reductase [Pseudomonadaceae bacterium]|nr:anaerobic ribonucleoside-triphosphate reductase [Pseudomonadaceae bacterium]